MIANYGYIRKDFPEATLSQIQQVSAYSCDNIFVEETSFHRHQELTRLLAQVIPGDTVIVSSLAVFGQTLKTLSTLMKEIQALQVHIISIQDELDTSNLLSFFDVVQAIARSHKQCQNELQRQSIEKFKEEGGVIGRPKLSSETVQKIHYLYGQKCTLREIAATCHISLGSVHKYVNELKQHEQEEQGHATMRSESVTAIKEGNGHENRVY